MQNTVKLLQIEPTTHCNFTCGFCYGRSMDQSDLEIDTFQKALEVLPDIARLELHGEGEPLMSPTFFEMANRATQLDLKVSMITNGSMFTRKNIERLLDTNVEVIFVSIESADPAQFKKIRGGSLERVKRGIGALLEARNLQGKFSPVVGLSVTVLKSTRDQLESIFSMYKELGMDGGISLHMLNSMPNYMDKYPSHMKLETLSDLESALVWLKFDRISNATDSLSETIHFSDEIFGGKSKLLQSGNPGDKANKSRHYRSCPWLDEGLYINRHGETSGCARIKETDQDGFGNIQSDISEILERRFALSQLVLSGENPGACANCFINDSIKAQVERLLPLQLSPSFRVIDEESWQMDHARYTGCIEYDATKVNAVLKHFDGDFSTEVGLQKIADDLNINYSRCRKEYMPIICEMFRQGHLVSRV